MGSSSGANANYQSGVIQQLTQENEELRAKGTAVEGATSPPSPVDTPEVKAALAAQRQQQKRSRGFSSTVATRSAVTPLGGQSNTLG